MSVFHVHADTISKGGSASGFANYLHRLHEEQATQHARYLARDGRETEDLIASGHDHLPTWADGNDHKFWLAADRYERKNAAVARTFELSLPRELSAQGQRDLADDIRQAFFRDHAHTWAMHGPQARDGSGVQPHLHVMFSARREETALERTPQQWFARAASVGKDPAKGGVRKDDSWKTKGRLYDIRWGIATLTNAALEREGIPLAVTHLSLRAQGLDRDPARYSNPHDHTEMSNVQTYRGRLHQTEKPFEQELARAAWVQQKQREGVADLSREAMVDRVRDHAFRYDRSPRRELERQQSFARSLARTRAPVTLERTQTPRERSPARTRTPARSLTQALERFTRGLGHGRDEAVGGVGLRVKLHEEDRAHEHDHDRGMSW